MSKVLNGSITAGQLLDNPDEFFYKIVGALDAVNDKDAIPKDEDLNFITPFIYEVEGENGTITTYEAFETFFGDNAGYLNPQDFNETYDKWSLNSRSYSMKNASFDPQMFKLAKIRGQKPEKLVMDRTEAIIRKYETVVKKNMAYESLFQVPTTGGSYYSKKGALRNTVVDKSILHDVDTTATAGALRSTTRNHFRCIESSAGLGFSDIQFVKSYFTEYVDIDPNSILCMGTATALGEFHALYDFAGTQDKFKITGTPTESIDGINFITSSMPSNDILVFIAGSAAEAGTGKIITKLINPIPEYQGLSISPVNSNTMFTDAYSLEGSVFEIQDVGYQVTGRQYLLFLDINKSRASSDRIMSEAGLSEITRRKAFLHSRWFTGVNEIK